MRMYCLVAAYANALTALVVGSLVLVKGQSAYLYRTYILACLSVLLWSLGYILWQLTTSATAAEFYCRLLMVGAIGIIVFYTHHLLLLLNQRRLWFLVLTYAGGAIFVLIDIFSTGIVSG